MNMFRISNIILCLILCGSLSAQSVTIEGYTFQSGNRGFMEGVIVGVMDTDSTSLRRTVTDKTGFFKITVPQKDGYIISAEKDLFEEFYVDLDGKASNEEDKLFVKIKMHRKPGYDFEVTLAEKRSSPDQVVDAIKGARIDVYNNTTREEVTVLYDHPEPQFNVPLIKGNHYTILIRKTGFLNKRVEAFVDVEGCILCFEGLGKVGPGVSDNLSRSNQIGVLLANVELERLFTGKTMEINNIYYALGSATIEKRAKNGLKKLAILMNDNPEISVEIGSHTDSRGSDDMNMDLSKRRARNVVEYLIQKGVESNRLIAKGYGEDQLVNECANNVYCPDEEHRKNRRTELKVIGINENGIAWRSLADMKRQEYGEELLEEIQFGGQVQVPVDVDNTAMKLVDTLKGIDLPMQEEVSQVVNEISEVVNNEGNQVEETDIEESVIKETEIMESEEEITPSSPVVSEGAVSGSEAEYFVVIHESQESIEAEHDLRDRHTNLIEYVDNDSGKYFYLVGGMKSLDKIDKFFKGPIKLAYPESYMVKFQDGKIEKI